jgi:hypothetical protein
MFAQPLLDGFAVCKERVTDVVEPVLAAFADLHSE